MNSFHATVFFSVPPENLSKPQTSGFLINSGGIKRDQWCKMGYRAEVSDYLGGAIF